MSSTKKTLISFMVLLLQACSAYSDATGPSSVVGVRSYPSGMSEVRRVRVSDLQGISLVVEYSKKTEIVVRVGSSSIAYLNIFLDCSKLRSGYYFSDNGKEGAPITVVAYWYGLVYREIDDKNSYTHVNLSVLPKEKIRVEMSALLKENNTGKILVVESSVVDIPGHAFIKHFNGC
jgi:hypothetical protein